MGKSQDPMVRFGSASQIGLVLLLGCAVACLASSEVVQLEEGESALIASQLGKKGKKADEKEDSAEVANDEHAHTGETSLRDGNKVQTPEERYKDVPKGSLAGEADPGYGPWSASRTDMQRTHEKEQERLLVAQNKARLEKKPVPPIDPLEASDKTEAKNLERHLNRQINGVAGGASATDEEKARSQANIVAIRRKALLIKEKLKAAKAAIKDHMVQQQKEEQRAEERAREAERQKELTPEEKEKEAIEAEEQKLKVQDHKELGSHYGKEAELFDKNEKIAVHKSGNWADKTRDPDFKKWRPSDRSKRKDPAAWRHEGDTPEAQKKP